MARAEINKHESEQMNRSSAWFDKHYSGAKVHRFIIHPSNVVQSAAAFTHSVEAVRESELKKLAKAVRELFKEFESVNFKDISTSHLQRLIDAHHLSVNDLTTIYSKKLRNLK
jgi:hypothetical protein